jgi:large subunit ribosomal protein L16
MIKKIFLKKHYKVSKLNSNPNNDYLFFGSFGFKCTKGGQLNIKQITTIKKIVLKQIKTKTNKTGKIYWRIFPNIPITKKPEKVRMGKGVGKLNHWVSKFNKKDVLFEVDGAPYLFVVRLINLLNGILPFRVELISNINFDFKDEQYIPKIN